MENNDFTILTFDTKLFGFKVAKILSSRLDLEHLQSILHTLREQGVKLVYWASDHTDEKSQKAACKVGGFLADMKVTYVTLTELKKLHLDKFTVVPEIIEYKSLKPSQALEKLAMEAGKYSHFKTDPQFPPLLFRKMYKKWITNSINGKISKHVLVYKKNRRIAGLITLGEKDGRGDIGLLAVDAAFRGQGIGYKLITAAQKQFLQDNYQHSQVVTQLGNVAACRIYEKTDYVVEKIENFYHFWLN
ncbi:MAG: hypothetical protein A2X78_03795 [Gammaproteobacteria bacterium GWE2_37_16]|nr:MAG: hypothetical protein A2X78_03795 [Gammaproteobacteria bacterium GWE2_37_16]